MCALIIGKVPRGSNGTDGFMASLTNDLQALAHLLTKVRSTKEGADEVISLIDSSGGHLFTSGVGRRDVYWPLLYPLHNRKVRFSG